MVKVRKILHMYLKTTSSNIVRVMSLQALADLALQSRISRDVVIGDIEYYSRMVNTASLLARSRKLLKQLAAGPRKGLKIILRVQAGPGMLLASCALV